jgi:2'-5' RNA ligase
VACYPTPEASENLAALAREEELAGARRVTIEQIHLTLLFIGDTDERQFDEVRESVARSVAGLGSFELQVSRLITLPHDGEPRVLAVETEPHATLVEIQRRLVTRLARPSQRRRGEAFLPHFTIARYGSGGEGLRVSREVAAPSVFIGAVRLMASELRPRGALHREVSSFVLAQRTP